ncbi:MAG: aminotransferase class IV [Prolixibacteraceae bacterium]|nr:aminotransferase class IV [Prolixibacteraceae bacterium]
MKESVLSSYILFNGTFYEKDDKLFTADIFENFLFKERIKASNCHILFWKEEIEQINKQLELFNIKKTSITQNGGKYLKRQIERSITKNKLFKDALITVYFSKNVTDTDYMIKTEKLTFEEESISEKGVFLSIKSSNIKNISLFSPYAAGSEIFWNYAKMNTKSPFEPLLLNHEGIILEVPGKNIFIISNNKVYTPNISEGAFRSTAFPLVREICTELKMEFIQNQKIYNNDLTETEEIFLAGNILGIQWVTGFENKRYFLKKTRQIANMFQKKKFSFT